MRSAFSGVIWVRVMKALVFFSFFVEGMILLGGVFIFFPPLFGEDFQFDQYF